MSPSRSFRTAVVASLLGCCHWCAALTIDGVGVEGADDCATDPSPSPQLAYGAACLLALALIVLPRLTPTATETRKPVSDTNDAEHEDGQEQQQKEEKDTPSDRTNRIGALEKLPADLLIEVMDHLATFHEDECRDILLCADESCWDESMDESLADIVAGAIDHIRDVSDESESKDTHEVPMVTIEKVQAQDISVLEDTDEEEEIQSEEVVLSYHKHRDVMSLYPSRDPVCSGPPALRSLDSEMSISSTSSASLYSLSSRSLVSRTRTRQMSPQRNAEWAIME